MAPDTGKVTPAGKKGVATRVTKPKTGGRAKTQVTTDFSKLGSDLNRWTNAQLKDRCRHYSLAVGGNKAALVARLYAREGRTPAVGGEHDDDAPTTATPRPPRTRRKPPPKTTSAVNTGKPSPKLPGKPLADLEKMFPSASVGKRVPKGGFRPDGRTKPLSQIEQEAQEAGPEPHVLTATQAEIDAAAHYRTEVEALLSRIQSEHGGTAMFSNVIHFLIQTSRELQDISTFRAQEDESSVGEVVSSGGEDDDADDRHDAAEVASDGSKESGSVASSPKRPREQEGSEEGHDESPPKRSKPLESSEKSEEE
ncbi:hypothetical protein LTR53_004580 [Teratosphaeriaceae sp. CCFEE 6253]|nr:hypothetical protein LTR53_004580 [Teratosphaeriaceae sp. CCFEE 6253]